MSGTDVLLSTDIGSDIDDAVATYIAANSDSISLKGIYVTNGPVEDRARIAARLMRLMGHDSLVAIGEAEPIFTMFPRYFTMMEGFSVPGNDKRMPLEQTGIERDWYRSMVAQLEKLGEAVLVSIAPLTTIAKLLERAPGAAARIKSLYVMGGRLAEGEYNFSQDSKAAQMVLASGLDIIVVPAGICEGYRLESEELTGLRGSSAQRYLATMAKLWKLKHESGSLKRSPGIRKFLDRDYLRYSPETSIVIRGLEALLMDGSLESDPFAYLRFFRMFKSLARFQADNPDVKALFELTDAMEHKDFAVHDAYTIYAIEHPDRIRMESVDISCDEAGKMSLRHPGRHRIVTDVDYRHFARYLKERLKEKPKRQRRVKA